MDVINFVSVNPYYIRACSTSNVTEEVEQEVKQQESRQGGEDDHKLPSPATEREYILRGSGIALMVQLFCIQEQYEMRSMAVVALVLGHRFLLFLVLRSVDLLPAVFQLFPVS